MDAGVLMAFYKLSGGQPLLSFALPPSLPDVLGVWKWSGVWIRIFGLEPIQTTLEPEAQLKALIDHLIDAQSFQSPHSPLNSRGAHFL